MPNSQRMDDGVRFRGGGRWSERERERNAVIRIVFQTVIVTIISISQFLSFILSVALTFPPPFLFSSLYFTFPLLFIPFFFFL